MTDLALALEGTAVRVLLHLAPAEQRDLQVLTRALERPFGQRTFSYQSQEQQTLPLPGGEPEVWHCRCPALRPTWVLRVPRSCTGGSGPPPSLPTVPYYRLIGTEYIHS